MVKIEIEWILVESSVNLKCYWKFDSTRYSLYVEVNQYKVKPYLNRHLAAV